MYVLVWNGIREQQFIHPSCTTILTDRSAPSKNKVKINKRFHSTTVKHTTLHPSRSSFNISHSLPHTDRRSLLHILPKHRPPLRRTILITIPRRNLPDRGSRRRRSTTPITRILTMIQRSRTYPPQTRRRILIAKRIPRTPRVTVETTLIIFPGTTSSTLRFLIVRLWVCESRRWSAIRRIRISSSRSIIMSTLSRRSLKPQLLLFIIRLIPHPSTPRLIGIQSIPPPSSRRGIIITSVSLVRTRRRAIIAVFDLVNGVVDEAFDSAWCGGWVV